MLHHKNNIIVALTMCHNELLRLSVRALARIPTDFLLVVYNDNPTVRLTVRGIRKMGYRGKVHIINGCQDMGTLNARLEILQYIKCQNIRSDWIVFANAGDVLRCVSVPNVSSDVFAVVQSCVFVRGTMLDFLRFIDNPYGYDYHNGDFDIVCPNLTVAGTPLRTDIMIGLSDIMISHLGPISELESSLPPIIYDTIMWNWVAGYVRAHMPQMVPIYMDSVNYVVPEFCYPIKKVSKSHSDRIAKFADTVFQDALSAAPLGQ